MGEVLDLWVDPDWELPPTFYAPILAELGVAMPREPVHEARVLQFRYVTQDRGQRVEATGMIGVPYVGPEQDFPLLLLLHGTSGFIDECAPSVGAVDPVLVSMLASFGYVVAAPDYIGMNGHGAPSEQLHPYLVGEPTAIGSLDAARAVLRLSADGLLRSGARATTPMVVSGGSQGGHAALFVGRYAPYYTPEIPVAAVAASVPPSDLAGQTASAVLQWDDGTTNTAALLGAAADWYGAADLSEVLLPPFDVDVPARMNTGCGLGGLLNPADSPEEAFTAEALAALAEDPPWSGLEPWRCYVAENSLDATSVAEIVSIPALFVTSEDDELVDTPVEREAFLRLCEQGIRIEYLECSGAGHTQGALSSFAEQLDFADARLRGDPWPEGDICVLNEPMVCSGMQ
jgi:acetyl esterase/lipase